LLSSDTNFGLGVTSNWEVGMSFPSILAQNVKSDINTASGYFSSTGVTEFRLMTKLRLLGGDRGGLAAVYTVNFMQIQNDPFLGTGAGPTNNFELAADTALGAGFSWAVNAGYRLRDPGTPIPNVPIQPLGNEYIASTALSYHMTGWDTKVIAEVFSSFPEKKRASVSDRSSSTAEALLGLKTDISRSLAFHVGLGSEIVHGTASPDWRAYTGINWVIGPVFNKPKPQMAKVRKQRVQQALDLMDTSSDPFSGTPQAKEEFVISDVLFEFDSDQIRPGFHELLQRLVNYLQQPPVVKSLVIEGHTDSIGSAEYNLDLSKRRAISVGKALISMGLPVQKIKAYGFGFSKPIASNGNFQGRALNRRVEFRVQR